MFRTSDQRGVFSKYFQLISNVENTRTADRSLISAVSICGPGIAGDRYRQYLKTLRLDIILQKFPLCPSTMGSVPLLDVRTPGNHKSTAVLYIHYNRFTFRSVLRSTSVCFKNRTREEFMNCICNLWSMAVRVFMFCSHHD
jgi:hypothetical protein